MVSWYSEVRYESYVSNMLKGREIFATKNNICARCASYCRQILACVISYVSNMLKGRFLLPTIMFARDLQAIANTVWLVINQSTRKGNIYHVHYSQKVRKWYLYLDKLSQKWLSSSSLVMLIHPWRFASIWNCRFSRFVTYLEIVVNSLNSLTTSMNNCSVKCILIWILPW